jgi:hypothetical protein
MQQAASLQDLGVIHSAITSETAWPFDRHGHRQAAGAVGTAAISVARRNLSKLDYHAQLDQFILDTYSAAALVDCNFVNVSSAVGIAVMGPF